MEVVDSAVPKLQKIAPSITKHTFIGLVIGAAIAAVGIVILALLDDTIHNEEYILENYDCPILAKVPDLVNSRGKRYGYYSRYGSRSYYGYGYGYGYGQSHNSTHSHSKDNKPAEEKKDGEK